MPIEKTILCNMGCDPELLERTHTIEYRNKKEYPITEYYCEGCGWEAVYIVGSKRLEIRYNPKEEMTKENYRGYDE